MKNLTGCQKLCFRIIGLVTVLYLIRHYSPQFIVDWAWDIDTPDIFTLAGNNPLFYFTESIIVHRSVPIFVCLLSALYVFFMYDIEEFIQYLSTPVTNQKGMTLVEVMVVVAIVGILSSIAALHLNRDSYKLRAMASNIRGTLQAVKMESIKTRENVSFGFNNTNKSVIDIWVSGNFRKSINLDYGVVIDSVNVPSGKIPDKAMPTSVPQSVMDQCTPPTPLAQCQALIDWGNQYKGKSYDHMIIFNSRGMVLSYGKFNIILNGNKISFDVNMVGNIKMGNSEPI